MATRNVTLALDEAMLRELKIIAARRGTSMSAIVREQIEEVVARGEGDGLSAEFLAARERALALMRKGSYRLPKGYKFNRDELYDDR